jgi:hypothetical protein
MMALYTTTTSSFRSTTTIHSRCSFTLLFAVLLSTLAVNSNNAFVNADTIFSEIMPTKCVNPALNKAGFCVLTHECTTTRECFEPTSTAAAAAASTSTTTANTNRLSLDIEGFYVPVDAVDCEQFEDPICPSTTCCPECQVELNELYKCFIMETVGLNYLDYLASTCPLDCIGFESGSESSGNGPVPVPVPVPVTTIAPVPVAITTAPVPVPVTTTAPVSVPVATTIVPVPVLTTIVPVPVPVATTIAPVPVVTAAPFYTIGLVDPDTSNSTTYLGFGELIVDGEDDVVMEEVVEESNITTSEIGLVDPDTSNSTTYLDLGELIVDGEDDVVVEEVIVEEIITSSNFTTSEKVKIGSVANDIP